MDKVTAERVEMQLSSKEKAMSNANGRVAEFSEKLEKSLKDVCALESLCSSLKKESDAVLGLDDESLAMWRKLESKAKPSLVSSAIRIFYFCQCAFCILTLPICNVSEAMHGVQSLV